jgi:hypothetical protein
VQAKFKPLLEADDEYAFGETPMNEPEPESEAEPAGWEAHLGEMVKAIIADETLSLDEKAKKIAHAVKLLQEEEEGKEGEADGGTEITEEDEEGDKKAETKTNSNRASGRNWRISAPKEGPQPLREPAIHADSDPTESPDRPAIRR